MLENEPANGIAVLAVANLVVMLLAYHVRQLRKANPAATPSLAGGITVCLVHAAVQVLAITIASNFIDDTRSLTGWAVALGALPTAWCLFLINDWWLAVHGVRGSSETAASTTELNMENAERHMRNGDYDAARTTYLEYAKRHPKSAAPLFALENVYLSMNRYRDAADTCRTIMRKFEHDADIWARAASRLAATLEMHMGKEGEAEEIREAIARRSPGKADSADAEAGAEKPVSREEMNAGLEKAREMAQRGSVEPAIRLLKRLRRSNPRDPKPLFEMAILLEADLRTDAAVRTLETIVRDFSRNPGIWSDAGFRLADIHVSRFGNTDKARELLQRIADNSPVPADREAAKSRLEKLDSPWG